MSQSVIVAKEGSSENSISSLKTWIDYLMKYWWLFAIVIVTSAVLGAWYSIIKKNKYEAKLTFALEEGRGGSLGGALSLASEFGFNVGNERDVFSGDNILEICNSRQILEKVLLSVDTLDNKRITLANEMMQFNTNESKLSEDKNKLAADFYIGLMPDKFTYLQDSIMFQLYSDIIKSKLIARRPDKRLNIYEIKFISYNERFSKIFIEHLMKELIQFYTELKIEKSKETLAILEERVNSLKGAVNNTITSRAATQDANLNTAFVAAQVNTQKQEIDIRVYSGAYAEMFKNLELARYEYLKSIPLLQIIDEPNYPMKKIRKSPLMVSTIFSSIAVFLLLGVLTAIRYFKMLQISVQTNFQL